MAVEPNRDLLNRPGFRYVPAGNLLLNAKLGSAGAWRVLWREAGLRFGGRDRTRAGDAYTGVVGALRRLRSAVSALVVYQRGRRGAGVLLPVDADLAIRRRSGAYKLLARDAGSVYTVVPDEMAKARLAEREVVSRRAATLGLAPKVKAVDIERGWLEEDLVDGRHPAGVDGCGLQFASIYLPPLVAFLRAEPPREVGLHEYARTLRSQISAPASLLGRLPPSDRSRLAAFADACLAGLLEAPDRRLKLVLSHGDYFSDNLLLTAAGPVAIDWASSDTRTALFDTYYLLMNQCARVLTPGEVDERAVAMTSALAAELEREDPALLAELVQDLRAGDEARLLFYLECVLTPLQRCDDPSDRYVAALLRRVVRFERHESATSTARAQSVRA